MTELEKIDYARQFIEKLANGVSPLTDKPIPAEEIVNNVRISRCLFYVAGILRQIAENGAFPAKKENRPLPVQEEPPAPPVQSGQKVPFFLNALQRRQVELSAAPISVSELVKRINAQIDPARMKRLTYGNVTEWLISIGFLDAAYDKEGVRRKSVTPRGSQYGLLTETRSGLSGDYVIILYREEAQQFLLDNLDAIVEFSCQYEAERREERRRFWTAEEEQELRSLFLRQCSPSEIAAKLGRTEKQVRTRMKKMGLTGGA